MSAPNPFPCGSKGQPACPPQPTAVINGVALYTAEQIHAHGLENYQKGRQDAMSNKLNH